MARSPNEKAEEAYKLYKDGMKLVEIASQLGCSAATIRTWKNRYKWDADKSETFQKKNETKRNVSGKSESKKNSKQKVVAEEVESVIQNTDLTDKQRLFCIYYIRCFNATKAYQKAYDCDYATAVVAGPRLLGNVRVKEEIHRLKQNRLNREFLSESDIFQKYMDIAFADLTDYMEWGHEEEPVITPAGPLLDNEGNTVTRCVSTLHLKDSSTVDGTLISELHTAGGTVSVKLADRMKALQWLTDHMDMATEEQKARIESLRRQAQTDDDKNSAVREWAERICKMRSSDNETG